MDLNSVRSVTALLLVGLVSAGCGGDGEPAERREGAPSSSASSTSEEPVAAGPIPGAGADIDPSDVRSWCLAITPRQLTSLTGVTVSDVYSSGGGLQTCVADAPGNELLAGWGSEPTDRSFDDYAKEVAAMGGGQETETVTLGDQPALLAWSPDAPSAYAGTVVDGRTVQVSVAGVIDQDADPEALAAMARQILAVYVG